VENEPQLPLLKYKDPNNWKTMIARKGRPDISPVVVFSRRVYILKLFIGGNTPEAREKVRFKYKSKRREELDNIREWQNGEPK